MVCISLNYLCLNTSTSLVWPNLRKLIFNDSLLVLYLLASSVATLWVFFLFTYFSAAYKYNVPLFLGLFLWLLIIYLGVHSDSVIFVSEFFKLGAVNVTLQNGLVNIHPIIIYYFYAFLISLSILLINQTRAKQFYRISTTKLYSFTNLLLLGVLLGALWAAQELNWGGLWSWDPVEILSIILALYILKILHNPGRYIEKNYTITWLLITGVIIVLILRIGVLTTIHSFVKGSSNPTHIKWCMFIIIGSCYVITGRDAVVSISYNIRRNNVSGSHLYSCALVLIYTYVLYLFMSVNTNIWKYITLDISNFSCILIVLYCFYKTTDTFNLGVKLWLCAFAAMYMVFLKFNYKAIILLVLSITVGLTDKFVPRLKILHKYLTMLYILVFCIVTNTLLQVTLIKYTQHPGLCVNSGGVVEALSNLYEIFIYLDKHVIITRLKSVVSHVQGFNIYSNGFTTLFSFSKNQNIFYLFSIEYIFSLVVYVFILGCCILNNKQHLFTTFKTY